MVNERKAPGVYTVSWDGRDQFGETVSSGLYFYIIDAGEFKQTKKVVLIK